MINPSGAIRGRFALAGLLPWALAPTCHNATEKGMASWRGPRRPPKAPEGPRRPPAPGLAKPVSQPMPAVKKSQPPITRRSTRHQHLFVGIAQCRQTSDTANCIHILVSLLQATNMLTLDESKTFVFSNRKRPPWHVDCIRRSGGRKSDERSLTCSGRGWVSRRHSAIPNDIQSLGFVRLWKSGRW
jgi:hypothetical protein